MWSNDNWQRSREWRMGKRGNACATMMRSTEIKPQWEKNQVLQGRKKNKEVKQESWALLCMKRKSEGRLMRGILRICREGTSAREDKNVCGMWREAVAADGEGSAGKGRMSGAPCWRLPARLRENLSCQINRSQSVEEGIWGPEPDQRCQYQLASNDKKRTDWRWDWYERPDIWRHGSKWAHPK